MKGILGRKKGMTQVFTKSGKLIPVTVIEVEPNVVTQIKTKENDGYEAIQLGFENIKEKNATKAIIGHAKKANTTPKRFFREIRGVEIANYNVGDEISVDSFTEGEVVDVTGTTKGHGFEGVITRHGQSRGPMGHGSQYHRGVGSLGTMRPMHVLKGKKLPGQMGNVKSTVQNLEIVKIDKENNCILIKGNVPGAKEGLVFIKGSIKTPGKINETEELVNYITVEDVVESEVSSEQTETEVNE